MYVGLKL